jgi:hypothetical protein
MPPENCGIASAMATPLQNTGEQPSMATFFPIVIAGLSTGLSGSVGTALASAGVPSSGLPLLGGVLSSSLTAAIFGAFLGVDPMGILLAQLGPIHPQPIPAPVITTLVSKLFSDDPRPRLSRVAPRSPSGGRSPDVGGGPDLGPSGRGTFTK